MWWYTFPMIIYTFFDKYDFSGKTIIPFNTHMGSGDGGTYDTIRKLEPKAKVLTGLPVEMRDAENGPAKAVERWNNHPNVRHGDDQIPGGLWAFYETGGKYEFVHIQLSCKSLFW